MYEIQILNILKNLKNKTHIQEETFNSLSIQEDIMKENNSQFFRFTFFSIQRFNFFRFLFSFLLQQCLFPYLFYLFTVDETHSSVLIEMYSHVTRFVVSLFAFKLGIALKVRGKKIFWLLAKMRHSKKIKNKIEIIHLML